MFLIGSDAVSSLSQDPKRNQKPLVNKNLPEIALEYPHALIIMATNLGVPNSFGGRRKHKEIRIKFLSLDTYQEPIFIEGSLGGVSRLVPGTRDHWRAT